MITMSGIFIPFPFPSIFYYYNYNYYYDILFGSYILEDYNSTDKIELIGIGI